MRKTVLTLLLTFGFMTFLCAQEGKDLERFKDELLKERQEIIQKLKRPQSALAKSMLEARRQRIDSMLEQVERGKPIIGRQLELQSQSFPPKSQDLFAKPPEGEEFIYPVDTVSVGYGNAIRVTALVISNKNYGDGYMLRLQSLGEKIRKKGLFLGEIDSFIFTINRAISRVDLLNSSGLPSNSTDEIRFREDIWFTIERKGRDLSITLWFRYTDGDEKILFKHGTALSELKQAVLKGVEKLNSLRKQKL